MARRKMTDKQLEKFVAVMKEAVPECFALDVVQHMVQNRAVMYGALCAALSCSMEHLFAELRRSCNQDVVDPEFTSGNFMLEHDVTGTKEIIAWKLGVEITAADAAEVVAGTRHTAIGIKRAMEYVARHPNLQKNKDLVVLGAMCQGKVPVFSTNNGSDRVLRVVRGNEKKFGKESCFLVVRNSRRE